MGENARLFLEQLLDLPVRKKVKALAIIFLEILEQDYIYWNLVDILYFASLLLLCVVGANGLLLSG